MVFSALARVDRNSKRFAEIVRTAAKYRLADWLGETGHDWIQRHLVSFDGQRLGELTREARIRMTLTELGTTFIKLGQTLSTRADLVGPELATELTQLQSQTPPDSEEVVRATIEAELGGAPEEIFAEFDVQPLGSASIAQVHRARTKDGQEVVVKVQHAGIEEKVRNDLDILLVLAQLAEKHSPQARLYQPAATATEFRRTLLRELDFTRERQNLDQFNKNFADEERVRIPKAFADLSSRRVLTMELFTGIPFSDGDRLATTDIDTSDLASAGANMFLEMIFRDGFYHADPHPGNLMLLSGGEIGVLDCGMVGRLDDTLRDEVETMVLAAVSKDADQLTGVVVRIGSLPKDFDRDALRVEIGEFVADYIGQSLDEFDLSGALNGMTDIIRRYRIILPPTISLLLRVLVMLEGTGRLLNPRFSLAGLLQPYYAKAMQRRFSPQVWLRKLQRTYRDWDRLLDMLPKDLADVLTRLRRGTFDVNLEHRRLDSTVNRLVLGILTAALFLGSTQLWSSEAPPLIGGVSVFGAVGYGLSIFLGFLLFAAIKKSGDISPKK